MPGDVINIVLKLELKNGAGHLERPPMMGCSRVLRHPRDGGRGGHSCTHIVVSDQMDGTVHLYPTAHNVGRGGWGGDGGGIVTGLD